MRLIDADALKDEVMKIWAYIQCVTGADVMDAVMTDIKNAPTVDAVQVVRCGDCRYWESAKDPDDGGRCIADGFQLTDREWYCPDGKRKEE